MTGSTCFNQKPHCTQLLPEEHYKKSEERKVVEFSFWFIARSMFTAAQNNSGEKGPWEVSSPTSCSAPRSELGDLSSRGLKNPMDGEHTIFSGHLFHTLTALMVKKVFHIPRTLPSNSRWIDTDKRDLLKMQMWREKGLFSYKCVGEEVFSIREGNNSLGLNENIFLRSRLAECHSQPPMAQLLL